ncbi:transglutaminase-like domain-containing protein [Hyphobacterium indicum]|uniref:transglutaminase-like domain-containing protein n=1 Tax=Hyphobacterium indicum TaxID=2162714 RepID=UPI0013753794|nr:transglutaminase-like domain-containing protein [Hyphobacterium indicum]
MKDASKLSSTVSSHVEKALAGLKSSASLYDRAAALNAYVHLTIERISGSTANNASEVLQSGAAVCGGMAMTLREMLRKIGLHAEYAYTYGGAVAHSMVEVSFTEDVHGLFDPYHGVAYYSHEEGRPLSIFDLEQKAPVDPEPIFYVRRSANRNEPLSRANVYSDHDEDGRSDFNYPAIFSEADGVGRANSGFVSFVNIHLEPGDILGDPAWMLPDSISPNPWSVLASWQYPSGRYLSWAYLMGQTSLGYRVEHLYTLRKLVPGRLYRLRLWIASAYSNKNGANIAPALTLHLTEQNAKSFRMALKEKGYPSETFKPQTVDFAFYAGRDTLTIIGSATGELVLQAIKLEPEEE